MNRRLDRTAIAALIPHSGRMCLLDAVVAWDATSVTCLATSHRDPDNPLAAGGRLETICGVEYASQAMAAHGGLCGDGRRPSAGYLASLRELVCDAERLDRLGDTLVVTAELLIAERARVIYRFALTCDDAPVLSGRAAVVLDLAG